MRMIKSPLNYTGNKFRILPQIQPYFPDKIGTMVDLFCGGATVGLNTECKKRIFIDKDDKVIGLLDFLSNSKFVNLYNKLLKLTDKYNLSKSAVNGYGYYKVLSKDQNENNGLKNYNKNGFYALREDYNALNDKNSEKAYILLYLLMLYAFNNDMRFSSDGKFNLPVGKTDLNNANILKLRLFIDRMNEIEKEFICGDFRDKKIKSIIIESDFIYMDPPYLITNAVYNEQGKWTEKDECDFMILLMELKQKNKKFVLSNVLSKENSVNNYLNNFISTNTGAISIIDIKYDYRSASYNKKNRSANEREIIVLPASMVK